MPPSLRDASYLWDIVDSSRLAIEATAELDFEGYQSSRLVQLAVERCVELIGEATRRLSDEFKATRPDVPWSKIVGQRNVLAHDYREIQHEKLWRLAKEELPSLIAALEKELPPPPALVE